jgi:hypothetical protein
VFFGKSWQTTMNIEIFIFPKKRKAVWATLHAIIALIGTKASKPALFCLNFEYKKENFYCFSVLQDVTWQFTHFLPLPPPLLGYWPPD